MILNLSLGALGYTVSPARAIEVALEYEYGALEFDFGALDSLGVGDARELRTKLGKGRLRLAPMIIPIDLGASDGAFQHSWRFLGGYHLRMTELGLRDLIVCIEPSHASLSYERNWALHTERLRMMADTLHTLGMRLGIEYIGPATLRNTGVPFIHTLSEAWDLVVASDCENVGVVIDSFHWYTSGETGDDLRRLPVERIVAVDVNDAPHGRPRELQLDLDRRLPWSTGVIDLEDFTRTLQDLSYRGPIRSEPFDRTISGWPMSRAIPVAREGLELCRVSTERSTEQ